MREQMLWLARASSTKSSEALQVIEEVNAAIESWPIFAREAGCGTKAPILVGKSLKRV
jgi:hypothetical protein